MLTAESSLPVLVDLASFPARNADIMLKSLSRAAAILSLAVVPLSGSAFAQNTEKAPPAVQAEFTTFIAKFRAAVKANDAVAVTALTKFPFRQMSNMRDENTFQKQVYPKLFNARIRECVQKTRPVYSVDGQGNYNYSLLCGKSLLLIEKARSGGEFRFTETHVAEGP
jgi:hypothetical protein